MDHDLKKIILRSLKYKYYYYLMIILFWLSIVTTIILSPIYLGEILTKNIYLIVLLISLAFYWASLVIKHHMIFVLDRNHHYVDTLSFFGDLTNSGILALIIFSIIQNFLPINLNFNADNSLTLFIICLFVTISLYLQLPILYGRLKRMKENDESIKRQIKEKFNDKLKKMSEHYIVLYEREGKNLNIG